AVRAQPVLEPVGQQRLLGERSLVQQQRHALAHRQLALLPRLLAVARRASLQRPLDRLVQAAHCGSPGGRGGRGGPWRREPPRCSRRRCSRRESRCLSTASRSGAGPSSRHVLRSSGSSVTTITQTGPKLPLAPLASQMATPSPEPPTAPPGSWSRRRCRVALRLASAVSRAIGLSGRSALSASSSPLVEAA